jgi:predicted transcriptional regulator of viral defense system
MISMKKPRFERLRIAKPDIITFFNSQSTRIFQHSDIRRFVSEQREFWRLTDSTTIQNFIDFLLENTRMQMERIEFARRPMIRYTWGQVPTYDLVLSWHPEAYLSHYTAVYLHDLTEQIPKTIYLNLEQRRKGGLSGSLTQEGLDAAFKRPMRRSKALAEFRDFEICILGSMGVDNLGVVEAPGPEGEHVRMTNVERTLIDITVRPGYAGGVFEVLKAFKNAKGRVSINRLVAMLKRLDYVYPYHQAIGFYLERAGVYEESSIRLLRKIDMNYDFYLAHGMKDPDYSKDWRLFFPKGL